MPSGTCTLAGLAIGNDRTHDFLLALRRVERLRLLTGQLMLIGHHVLLVHDGHVFLRML